MTRDADPRIRLLFVCLGNICRSPTAQGVAEAKLAARGQADLFEIDSAGTHAYHVGNPPDSRARRAAAKRGIELGSQRARRVDPRDFERFDYILAMDERNLEALQQMAPAEARAKLVKILSFGSLAPDQDVPDPFYGGSHGFEHVLDLLDDAIEGLLVHLAETHDGLGGLLAGRDHDRGA